VLGKAAYPRGGKQPVEQRSVAQQESEEQESGKGQRGTGKGSFRYEVTTIALDIWVCQTRNFGFSVTFCRME